MEEKSGENLDTNSEVLTKKKRDLVFYYGLMTLPMRQWFEYIITDYNIVSRQESINTQVIVVPPDSLKAKAFSVWFYSAMDILEKSNIIYSEISELEKNNIQCNIAKEHIKNVIDALGTCVSVFTQEEQLFLRDRRLQNTHGFLSSYFNSKLNVKWFEDGDIKSKEMTIDEYNLIMRQFYPKMHENQIALIKKFLSSENSKTLIAYWLKHIRSEGSYFGLLGEMARELGIVVKNNGETR